MKLPNITKPQDRKRLPVHAPLKPKANILVDQNREQYWQAKVHRSDTGGLLYETTQYLNARSAYEDAQAWVDKNHYYTGSITGIRIPRPAARPHKLRSYSTSWSGG
jgi:hypothetical protein